MSHAKLRNVGHYRAAPSLTFGAAALLPAGPPSVPLSLLLLSLPTALLPALAADSAGVSGPPAAGDAAGGSTCAGVCDAAAGVSATDVASDGGTAAAAPPWLPGKSAASAVAASGCGWLPAGTGDRADGLPAGAAAGSWLILPDSSCKYEHKCLNINGRQKAASTCTVYSFVIHTKSRLRVDSEQATRHASAAHNCPDMQLHDDPRCLQTCSGINSANTCSQKQ